MKRLHNITAVYIALGIFILDRLTKILFENTFELGESVPLIKNIVHFTLVHNEGAGFGILQHQKWFPVSGRPFFLD